MSSELSKIIENLGIDLNTHKTNNISEIFYSSQYEYFFNIEDADIQNIIIDSCIDEIYNILSFCLKRCRRILPNEEYDESLDNELFDEINSLPNFFEILSIIYKRCNANKLTNKLFYPQFFYGFKTCNNNSKFVQMINDKFSSIGISKIINYRNVSLIRILTEFSDKSELSHEQINYLLEFLSNYTFDDTLYQYLNDSKLIDRYYNVINNLFTNLLSDKYKKLKIGSDNCRILLTNLFMIECNIGIPLKFDLLIENNKMIFGHYYKKNMNEYIALNFDEVADNFYDNLILIEIIFHEKRHYEQVHDKKINYKFLQFIKDNYLIALVDNYYDADMNYEKVSIEVDARMFGRIYFHKWLKKISPSLAKEKEPETKRKIQRELILQKSMQSRKVNKTKETTLDVLFESSPYEWKKSIITDYPLLSYEYDGDSNRYCTLELIIKKFYYQSELKTLSSQDLLYLEIVQIVKLYNDIINKRILTYENILDDLNRYRELKKNLTYYFADDILLRDEFINEVRKFYFNRLPIIIMINKINEKQLYDNDKLSKLIKDYQCKIQEFISGQNDDILDIIKQDIIVSNKRM